MDYWDQIADISRRAAARRAAAPGHYVSPSTAEPPPSELPRRESDAPPYMTVFEYYELVGREGTAAERATLAALGRLPDALAPAPRAERDAPMLRAVPALAPALAGLTNDYEDDGELPF